MEKKDNIFERFAQQNKTANWAGLGLTAAGLFGAIAANRSIQTYEKATENITRGIRQIGDSFNVQAQEADKALTADLAGYQSGVEANVRGGLKARGINEPGVADYAVGQVKAGLSGAYASAHAALAGAKLKAKSAITSAQVNYQMDLAQKQYASQMQKYYSNMGIWGALGGIGGELIAAKGSPSKQTTQEPPKESTVDYVKDLGNYGTEPFKMQGVK